MHWRFSRPRRNAPQQRADRVGHCADGAQQLIVDTGDERHGTAGDTGHHIRSTHRHAFGVQQKRFSCFLPLNDQITGPLSSGTKRTVSRRWREKPFSSRMISMSCWTSPAPTGITRPTGPADRARPAASAAAAVTMMPLGRQCRPALPTIAPAKDHIAQLEFDQALLGTILQRLDALDGEHPLDQLRQHGGLIARTGPDLQHLVQRAVGQQQQLAHARNHERLRNSLVVADGKRRVPRRRDAPVPRRRTDDEGYGGSLRAHGRWTALLRRVAESSGHVCVARSYPSRGAGCLVRDVSQHVLQPALEAVEGLAKGSIQLQRGD